jgi:hypothetical protein
LYPDAYTVAGEENQMLGRAFLLLTLLWSTAQAGEVVDAAGRNVQMPNQIARVLPAGPPAAILLEVLAPDLILDYGTVSPPTGCWAWPGSAAAIPRPWRRCSRPWSMARC